MDHIRLRSQLRTFPLHFLLSLPFQLERGRGMIVRGMFIVIMYRQGCLLLFFGRVADLYGRKRTFLAGIALLGAFGLGCGFAQGTSQTFFLI